MPSEHGAGLGMLMMCPVSTEENSFSILRGGMMLDGRKGRENLEEVGEGNMITF